MRGLQENSYCRYSTEKNYDQRDYRHVARQTRRKLQGQRVTKSLYKMGL